MLKRQSLIRNQPSSGFIKISDSHASNMPPYEEEGASIPLRAVTTNTTARTAGSHQKSPIDQSNEKMGLFHRKSRMGRRRKQSRRARDGDGKEVTRMGRIYNSVLSFSLITRYLLYLIPVGALLAIPIVIGATAAPNALAGGVRIVWIFTWVEVVWISLWVSKLFAKTLPYVFQFLCGIVSAGTRKYSLVLKALEIPISLAGWALASLATFQPLMTRNPDQVRNKDTAPKEWEDVMQKILAAFLVTSLIFLGEKFFVQLVSIGYHRQQYDQRIKDSKSNIHSLTLLYDASRALFPDYCPEFAGEDYLIQDSTLGVTKSRLASKHARSGSATPLAILHKVGRVGDKITSAFSDVAHEVTGKDAFNPTASHSIVVEALEKRASSEALAKRIWMSFVVEGKEALYQEDIVEVLGPDQEAQAEESFGVLDRDGNGDISLDEMIMTVCEFGRERKSIASSLHDVDQAINVLDNLMCTIVFIICVFIFVAFLNANFTTTLATAGTALLSLSFVFSATAQEVLGSCIFLFVKHPFDVGDRVDIGDKALVVERISLLYTVFKEIGTHKTTQVPNLTLNSLWIDNITRSKAMRERLLVYVSFDTTLEDVQLLRDEMQNFVCAKENMRDFQADVEVEITGIAEMNKLELKVEIKHKSNWSNEAVRASRRSKFMCALVLALRKVPIYAPGGGGAALGSADQPSYSVAVNSEQAESLRDTFAKNKEAKRLVPSKPAASANDSATPSLFLPEVAPHSPIGGGHSTRDSVPGRADPELRQRSMTSNSNVNPEEAALAALNARDPASDPAHDWERQAGASPTRPSAPGGGLSSIEERQRDVSIDEVRDVLRRQSTRGKRTHSQTAASWSATGASAMARPTVPTIAEPTATRGSNGSYDEEDAVESVGGMSGASRGPPPNLETYQVGSGYPGAPSYPAMRAPGVIPSANPQFPTRDLNNSFMRDRQQ